VTYVNQIVIASPTFSAGGDSGALIVTDGRLHSPVALLFAGSSTVTIANPIGEVLTQLGAALGRTFSFGGGSAPVTTQADDGNIGGGGRQPFTSGIQSLMPQLPQKAADRALKVLEVHRANLMFQSGVMGAGIGLSGRADGEAAILIYVNKDSRDKPILPDNLEGVPLTVILTDQFVAR